MLESPLGYLGVPRGGLLGCPWGPGVSPEDPVVSWGVPQSPRSPVVPVAVSWCFPVWVSWGTVWWSVLGTMLGVITKGLGGVRFPPPMIVGFQIIFK